MSELIVSRHTLPEHLLSRIHSDQIMVREDNGTITLTPVHEKPEGICSLLGMLVDSGMSTEAYCRQKQLDKELE
ncbi:MAG: hypothetical protein LBS31_12805 [Candidatus Adiutrix sp.]|jgi:hypothetical protein|nr:hypothetical protein [Candidatus Adiutrix sp.]